jgi:hypothetical protein
MTLVLEWVNTRNKWSIMRTPQIWSIEHMTGLEILASTPSGSSTFFDFTLPLALEKAD